ncbi:MAG TPA: hypothetical protein VN231_15080 [Allosphingosinicella sp.]|nr:hypothetical protein [Allosphingosinicella sp.]
MARLRDRLEAELGNWASRLPEAWRARFEGVALDFDSCDPSAELRDDEHIWPQETNEGGAPGAHLFKAMRDLDPSAVRVVIFGNDPYTRIGQATGRSFEQGDLEQWAEDLATPRRVSPSLQSLVCAALATTRGGAGYSLTDIRQLMPAGGGNGQPIWFCHVELARAIRDGAVAPPAPREIFGGWARQGVLWLNRTLTFTRWLDDAEQDTHRSSHQKLWAPFTERALRLIAEEAAKRPIVVVMWGSSADDLVKRIREIAAEAGAPAGNVRVASTGHPQWPQGYFRVGNPLTQINYAIGGSGPLIDWGAAGGSPA